MPRPSRRQLALPLSPIRNSELFSNHWLNHRLPLEPEWLECRTSAAEALDSLLAIWRVQKGRVEQYGSEQSLEQAFIQPVLEALGWKLIYQTRLRGRKPDYAVFSNDEALDASLAAGRGSPEFWQYPIAVADAKAWHVSLDRPTIVGQQREYPPEQIEWYLNNSGLDYGVLTNGRQWRLIPRQHDPGQSRFQTYLECDLLRLLNEQPEQSGELFRANFDDFLRFFLFFSPVCFGESVERKALVVRARQGSSEYRIGVGEDLKERVLEALRLCIEGFLSFQPNRLRPADLETCRRQGLILLYRILFILFAEDRQLLPFGVDVSYTANRSLGRFRDDIAARLDRVEAGRQRDYGAEDCGLWPDLLSLFDLIDRGGRYGVPAYNGGLFDPELHTFLVENVLPDRYLARIIDQLGRAVDPTRPGLGHVRVDYRDLAIQHLGDVYEGLLEVRPHYATEEMIVVRKRDSERSKETIVPADKAIEGYEFTGKRFNRGEIYLLTEKGERRASGSYYTPSHIVDYIVDRTLAPLCDELDKKLKWEKAQFREVTIPDSFRDFSDRVLGLRILDPAMGSGHFLIRACQFFAEQVATNPNTRHTPTDALRGDESILTYWKRRIGESCLFGVDKNPLAVELAKLALWLETVAAHQPLTFLDHHFREGDSLVGASIEELGNLPDAPPLMRNEFQAHVQRTLPKVLKALTSIQELPSDDVRQVKAKQAILHKELEPLQEPLRSAADLWCSTLVPESEARLRPQQYEAALQYLDQPKKLRSLLDGSPYRQLLDRFHQSETAAFHWQLEFPTVFMHGNPGFHAVVGNPPYDVLSEKETGHDLSYLRVFLRHSPTYLPSFKGKNNLYKLFICRAVELLAEGGRLGFICPMPILGDEQASGIRERLLFCGAFKSIEVFPQKDDVHRRVFRDAKLSTAVFVFQKFSAETRNSSPFTVRVHPGSQIEKNSPGLVLTASDIPLYDPENRTIVSCSQQDWDLAVRLMHSGRMQRLGDVCVSFQGEVNETTDTKKGAISTSSDDGPLVLRGSNVCLYVLRGASQGDSLFLREDVYLSGKKADAKAFHGREPRVGFQRSSPQNNFRRIVACFVPAHHYCFDTVSYIPRAHTQLPLPLVLGLLNSKLLDWYFRLGSTNSKVNEYQFDNLPCPIFAARDSHGTEDLVPKAFDFLRENKPAEAVWLFRELLDAPPFSGTLGKAIIHATKEIMKLESARGDITRSDRSELSDDAKPYQQFIDSLVFGMAGLSENEALGLQSRLEKML